MCVCACVRACVRVCVHVHMCVRVCVCVGGGCIHAGGWGRQVCFNYGLILCSLPMGYVLQFEEITHNRIQSYYQSNNKTLSLTDNC